MIILIQGANNSGKSAYAEQRAAALGCPLCYVATMIPYGEEGATRVRKHTARRANLGFTTIEAPYTVNAADAPPNCAVLIEDASNLLANNLFDRQTDEAAVYEDIRALSNRVRHTIIVTISQFDEADYNPETQAYIKALQSLNAKLSTLSDEVITMPHL